MADKLFLSYGRSDDEPFVRRLYEDLKPEHFDAWFDRVDMPRRGLTFLREIRDEIDQTDRVILIVGPDSTPNTCEPSGAVPRVLHDCDSQPKGNAAFAGITEFFQETDSPSSR